MTKKEALAQGYCRDLKNKKKINCAHFYSVWGVYGCQHGRLPSLHIKTPVPGICPLSDETRRTLKP